MASKALGLFDLIAFACGRVPGWSVIGVCIILMDDLWG